jgi:hypothetical protein
VLSITRRGKGPRLADRALFQPRGNYFNDEINQMSFDLLSRHLRVLYLIPNDDRQYALDHSRRLYRVRPADREEHPMVEVAYVSAAPAWTAATGDDRDQTAHRWAATVPDRCSLGGYGRRCGEAFSRGRKYFYVG